MTNSQVEDEAIALVMDHERREGRNPHDSRRRRGTAGDVESSGRIIETKAFGKTCRGEALWLEVRQVEEARRNPDFFVYVVENVRTDSPTLKVLGGDHLQRLIDKAKEQRYFLMPWPTADYDATPTEGG